MIDVIRTLPTEQTSRVVRSNLDLVGFFSHPEILVPLLLAAGQKRSRLEAIAAQSYRHVNQFDKIVLAANPDPGAYRLTLHLWRPPYDGEVRQREYIHEHRFNFWSAVLAGTLVSGNYRVAETGEGATRYRRYRYVPERARDLEFEDFYDFQGDVHLEQTDTSRHAVGQTYYLPAPSIHHVELPVTETVCSLVLRGPRLRDHSYIFNRRYPSADTSLANKMFTPDELEERLNHVVDQVARQSPANAGASS